MVKLGIFGASIILLAGCGSVPIQLKPEAEKIQIVDYIKPGLRGALEEIDQVKCKLGENFKSKETNIEACHNQLRNKALSLNGDLVLVTNTGAYEMSSDRAFIAGTKECGNCVEMRGLVFRKK